LAYKNPKVLYSQTILKSTLPLSLEWHSQNRENDWDEAKDSMIGFFPSFIVLSSAYPSLFR
jgi:hypothetical protein